MAFTATQKTEAYQFFIVAFGAAPGADYWTQLTEAYESGMTTQQVVNVYTNKPQFEAIYPTTQSDAEFAAAIVANVVGESATAEAKQSAVDDIVTALAAGLSKGDVIYNIFSQLASKTESEKWGTTAKMLANKVVVAQYVTEDLALGGKDLAKLQAYVADVTQDPATVTAAKEAAEAGQGGGGEEPSTPGETFRLTVGQDDLEGTANNDTFKAYVSQNILGQQANTLGSGDYIDGGAGYDTLDAKVTAGAYVGTSWNMPIQAETTSVEHIQLQAVWSGMGGSGDMVFVNAKDMVGVQKLSSNHSDADLVVQNMTTKGLNKLSDMTINMSYTGNADSMWNESDFTVYFDQDYLVPGSTLTKPSIEFVAMNEDGYDQSNGTKPLEGVFFRQLQFTLNGKTYDLTQYMGEDRTGAGDEIITYQDFLTAVQSALVQLKAANKSDAALQTVSASFGNLFETDINPATLQERVGQAIRLEVDGETNGVANAFTVLSTDLEVARAAAATVANNNRFERADNTTSIPVDELLAINVELEKVGLAGDGGQLIIGSMNKTSDNEWDAVNTVGKGTIAGIQQFDVTVKGDASKSSSLAGLHSTNNELRVVNIKSEALLGQTSFANLQIGNSNTNGYALKDVQILDATQFKGDLAVFADLTDEIVAKYLDRQDTDAPGADNVAFKYLGGSGNDLIDLEVDTGVWSPREGAATREDFSLTIDGGAGDDEIVLDLGIDSGVEYHNQSLMQAENESVKIFGGAGNDTIWTPGAGDVFIDGGDGNDAIYVDNTGDNASWMLNSFGPFLPMSGVNHSYDLVATKVVVSYKGFEVEVDLVSAAKGVVTDLEINQAVKKAINDSNSPLSKLLTASDAQGNALLVRSLIDGDNADEFSVQLKAGTVQLSDLAGTPWTTVAQAQAAIAQTIATFNDPELNMTYVAAVRDDGEDAHWTSHSDNTIVGGKGDDVLVLGTGFFSNDTVVYEGYGNGSDTIVNFETGKTTVTPSDTDYYQASVVSVTATFSNITSTTPVPATLQFNGGLPLPIGNAQQTLLPGADVAYAFFLATGGSYVDGDGVTWAVAYEDGALTLTNAGPTAVALGSVVPTDFVLAGGTGSVTLDITDGYIDGSAPVDGTFESFTVDFNGSVVLTTGSFAFDGQVINYAVGDGPIELSAKVLAATFPNWTVESSADGVLLFTATTPGNKTDATEANFGVVAAVPAVPAVPAEVELVFDAATGAGDITVAGVTVTLLGTEDAAAVAAAVVAALNGSAIPGVAAFTYAVDTTNTAMVVATQNAGANFDAAAATALFTFADGGTGVTAAAPDLTTPGANQVPAVPANANGIFADVLIADGVDAVAAVGELITVTGEPVVVTNEWGMDYLDFSAYDVAGVLVDGVLVAGTAATAGQGYISLVESATNAGSYTATHYTEAGATDTVLGLVGVLDFGATQEFVADNFVL